MYYFQFLIGTNADGSRVSYSPNWAGTMPKCPKNVDVLVYDDDLGEGIATTDDSFIPPEVEVLTELTASGKLKDKKVKKVKDDKDKLIPKENRIYFKGTEKWDKKWASEVLNG